MRAFFLVTLIASCGKPVTFSGNNDTIREMRIQTSQKYPAREEIQDTFQYNFKTNNYSQKIVLSAKPPAETKFFQIDRSPISEEFTQGFSGDQVTENFSTKTPDKLDLLVVIDDSSSMRPYQNRLAPQLAPLLSHISNTDWQIMVISTTPIRKASREPGKFLEIYGCPRKNSLDPADDALITKKHFEQDPIKAAKRFAWKVSIGDDSGDPVERGLFASMQGLRGECGDPTKSWIRPGSHRAILILTDEENCGSDPDQNCDDKPDSEPGYFVNNVSKGTQFFALLHDKDRYSDTCLDEGYLRKPDDYRTVIALTNGMEGNICAANYESILTEISKNIHQVNKVQYQLKSGAANFGAEVLIDGKPQNISFSIENNILTFLEPLPNHIENISVSYKVNVTPRFRAFKISQKIDINTLTVFVNNVKIEKDLYSISEIQSAHSGDRTKQLEFHTEPPDLAKIKVFGRDSSQQLLNMFSLASHLPDNTVFSSVRVLLNGISNTGFRVDASTRELYFDSSPQDGAEIVVLYETEDSRKTSYLVPMPVDLKISNYRVVDEQTSFEIPAGFENGVLKILPTFVKNGRSVVLNYTGYLPQKNLKIQLPNVPLQDTLVLKSLETTPPNCLDHVQVEESALIFKCGGENFGQMTVDYKYLSDTLDQYKLPKNPDRSDFIRVFIDDRETPYFRVEGDHVLLDRKNLKSDSRVETIIESIIYY
jgi:hypothetical protein